MPSNYVYTHRQMYSGPESAKPLLKFIIVSANDMDTKPTHTKRW